MSLERALSRGWGVGGARQGGHRGQADQVCNLLNLARKQLIAQEEFKAAYFLSTRVYGRRQ